MNKHCEALKNYLLDMRINVSETERRWFDSNFEDFVWGHQEFFDFRATENQLGVCDNGHFPGSYSHKTELVSPIGSLTLECVTHWVTRDGKDVAFATILVDGGIHNMSYAREAVGHGSPDQQLSAAVKEVQVKIKRLAERARSSLW